MNLVMAKVDRGRRRARSSRSAARPLQIPESVCRGTPGAAVATSASTVALGVRSEDMEDATPAGQRPGERRIKGKVTLTEALGSEIVVHFTFPGDAVVTEDTKLIAKEAGGERAAHRRRRGRAAGWPPSRRGPGCGWATRSRSPSTSSASHYFDPETSQAIRA